MKHNHKPTSTPPSDFIAAAYNHFLPLLDDNDDNDADPTNLMGKYNGGGKKKGKGGHRRRYRGDGEIGVLHGLYKYPNYDNDNGRGDDDDDDGYWDDM